MKKAYLVETSTAAYDADLLAGQTVETVIRQRFGGTAIRVDVHAIEPMRHYGWLAAPQDIQVRGARSPAQVAAAHEFAWDYVQFAESEMDGTQSPGARAWLDMLYHLAFGIALTPPRGDHNPQVAWANTLERLLSWIRLNEEEPEINVPGPREGTPDYDENPEP